MGTCVGPLCVRRQLCTPAHPLLLIPMATPAMYPSKAWSRCLGASVPGATHGDSPEQLAGWDFEQEAVGLRGAFQSPCLAVHCVRRAHLCGPAMLCSILNSFQDNIDREFVVVTLLFGKGNRD